MVQYLPLGAVVPTLTLGTAVIACTNAAATFPNCSTCASTLIPSTTCPRLSVGTNYANFNGSTVVDVDGSDTFTVALMIANVGQRTAYEVVFSGSLNQALQSPDPSATFCLTLASDGSTLSYAGSLFDVNGISLDAPLAPGAIAIATFDILLDDNVTALDNISQYVCFV
jgi:hypothetical protein